MIKKMLFAASVAICSVYAEDADQENKVALGVTENFDTKGEDMNKEFSQVRAKHILVKTKEEATKILSDINAGGITFEQAAEKYSNCGSKVNGGDLGFFSRGAMVKEFEEVAFSLEPGKISDPVQTDFGWHLIKVESRQ